MDLREVRLGRRGFGFGFAALDLGAALRVCLRIVFFFPRIAGAILLRTLVVSSSRQPCASRTEIIAWRILFQVSCFIMTALGNMQPSQQIWRSAFVSFPSSPWSQ